MNILGAFMFAVLCCACGYGATEAAIRSYRDFRWAWIKSRNRGYIPREPGEPERQYTDYRGHDPWGMLFVRGAFVMLPLSALAVGFGGWAVRVWTGD